MNHPLRSLAPCLIPGLACVAIAAGCGGSGSDTVAQGTRSSGAPEAPSAAQPLSPAEAHGRDLFIQRCGACHTFEAAGTLGNVGPDLGDIAVDEADVLHAIRTGGGRHAKGQESGPSGNMPRNLVTGKDAQDVAAFVAANASGSSTP
ncbi:MAG TPA: cytochrome c [Solirubrobacterales bacterium]|nr:cytochrome c [Solirubrobacterales bacterium]